MNEHSFRNTLRRLAKQFDPDIHIWKINDGYEGGVPDFMFETNSAERWVESKYTKNLPKRDTTTIDFTSKRFLSPLQVLWLNRREQRFKDAAVVIGVGESRCEGVLLLRNGDWMTPLSTRDMRTRLIPPSQLFLNLFK